jgi:hypothetical protein
MNYRVNAYRVFLMYLLQTGQFPNTGSFRATGSIPLSTGEREGGGGGARRHVLTASMLRQRWITNSAAVIMRQQWILWTGTFIECKMDKQTSRQLRFPNNMFPTLIHIVPIHNITIGVALWVLPDLLDPSFLLRYFLPRIDIHMLHRWTLCWTRVRSWQPIPFF